MAVATIYATGMGRSGIGWDPSRRAVVLDARTHPQASQHRAQAD